MKIKGLDKALKELKALDPKAKQGIIQSLEVAGVEAVEVMQINTPVDLGKLRQGNSFVVNRDALKVTLFNNVPYAPFIEFGTGQRVEVPNELKEIAIQFKGKKDIPFGIHPQPFLYPGLLKGRQVFLKQIQLLVKSLK